ncbi:hypothetical protein RCCS2_00522 [Roseobacter sp. CCS2]|nr:hypothetical protein RCCS2_00522 [Roseobacter sp. CCS2]
MRIGFDENLTFQPTTGKIDYRN